MVSVGKVWGKNSVPHTLPIRNRSEKCGEGYGQAYGNFGEGGIGNSRNLSGWRRAFTEGDREGGQQVGFCDSSMMASGKT